LTYSSPRPLKLPTKTARLRIESKLLWNEARSPSDADFFTLGYEGRSRSDVIALLRSANVVSLLDIRHNPVSAYKPEFSKANLQRSLDAAGIHYNHIRQWGVPKVIRAQAVETGTRDTIWQWYDCCVVDPYFERNLHWFLNLDHPVAFMCMEHDPTECHRHRIFLALERHGLRGFDL
jgi:uncharacterized protein (DUF488 family)